MSVKQSLSRLPGTVETYKVLKNLRYLVRSRLNTTGGIRGGEMNLEEAVAYVGRIFRKVDAAVDKVGGWQEKRVLEVGPGDSLGVGLLALAHGARAYWAIDRFPVGFDLDSERRMFEALLAPLSPDQRDRVTTAVQLTPQGYQPRGDAFRYFNSISMEEASRRFASEEFDVIFSNAVLEHVGNLESSLRSMRSLIAPGGVMMHDVDLRSHQRFEKHALHFLEYPTALWWAMTSNTGEPNRDRLPTYRRILQELGFEDVQFQVSQRFDSNLVKDVRPRLARPFRSLSEEDLSVALFLFTARAPQSAGVA